jgi:hypothetical protein
VNVEDLQAFVASNVTDENRIRWPDDAAAQKQLARDFLGCSFIASLDYWVDHAEDYLKNPEPSKPFVRHNNAWERDSLYRACFRGLEGEERGLLMKLICEVASGVLFSALVAVDQLPQADVDVDIVEREDEEVVRRINVTAGDGDMHDELFEWIRRFSKHAAEFERGA